MCSSTIGNGRTLWLAPERCYLVVSGAETPRFEKLVGRQRLEIVAESGGKLLLTNRGVE